MFRQKVALLLSEKLAFRREVLKTGLAWGVFFSLVAGLSGPRANPMPKIGVGVSLSADRLFYAQVLCLWRLR